MFSFLIILVQFLIYVLKVKLMIKYFLNMNSLNELALSKTSSLTKNIKYTLSSQNTIEELTLSEIIPPTKNVKYAQQSQHSIEELTLSEIIPPTNTKNIKYTRQY